MLLQNLTTKQWTRLEELLRYTLKTIRAYLLKESFQALWEPLRSSSGRA